jgi:amino acid adenylation domain-containing protein
MDLTDGSFDTLTSETSLALNSEAANRDHGSGAYSASPANSGASNFWEEYLSDVPALELPTDRPRPAVLGKAMGIESRTLSAALMAGLNRLSSELNVEAEAVTLGIFVVLLRRYTAQEKFAVGVARGSDTLPIVAEFGERSSFRQLVRRIEAALTRAAKSGSVPADLASRLGLDANASRHAIFQVGFSTSTSTAPAGGLDLVLELSGNELTLRYNQDLFEPATALRMLGHLEQLLASAVEDANRTAAELRMLTDRELHELLVERNQTAREFPRVCLHQLVESVAAEMPEEIAVISGDEQLTYGEFNARSNQMAHFLRQRGVGRNVRVGVCLPRSLDFAVSLLGVLKAGGTVVPLDPKYPSERLTMMLEDVAAPVVLTERGLLETKIAGANKLVHVSEQRATISKEPRTNPSLLSQPGDIAYVIYTSGSTGRPRGVLLPHAGLANYTQGAIEMFSMRPGECMLQFCSISFDAAIEEIFSTWASGATLVFRDDNVSLEPSEFLAWAAKNRITAVDLPTAYWHEWVYALPTLAEKAPPSLRLVIVGGEKAKPEAFAAWHKAVGNRVNWVNTYGPAEASVVATAHWPEVAEGAEPPARLPIGRPVANARIYLLDPDLNPVPVGVPGEIHIAGAGVAQGYLNLPQMTAEKFIADPFSENLTTRMYKTGDLARYLPTGELEFVGRRDNQVKIRGFRVEPGEIETILAKHSAVNEVAVILREDATGNKRLVGYVVASDQGREQKTANESELRRHVKKHLPEYMVPSEFVFLDAMPLTPNGKINRRALQAMKVAASVTAQAVHDGVQINDALQAQLVAIWEELLGRKGVGVRDNFFDLGGHSLLAARLMYRIKQTTGKTLPLAALLQAPTIEQLAAVLREDFSHHWSSLVAVQPDGSKPPFFMVHGVGGNVVGFIELARHMKPDYPFYGLQSQGLDGKQALLTSIEAMAAHYLEEMRTVQPKGPYHIGGFSLGGVVAYEMARQLAVRGEEVGLLVLFDTYATNPKKYGVKDFLRNPSKIKWAEIPGEIRRKIRRTMLAARLPEELAKIMRTNGEALTHYRPEAYLGKAYLLRAQESWLVKDDPYAKWRELTGDLEIVEIGGAHMDILREPQVAHLAFCLKRCIDQAGVNEAELVRETN